MSHSTPVSRLFTATVVGVVQGIALGLVLFVAEPLVVHRASLGYFGSPLSTIAALYCTLGAAVGVAVGLGAGVVASISRLRAPVLSLAILTGVFLTMFVLRTTPASQLPNPGASKLLALGLGAALILVAATVLHRTLDARAVRRLPPGGVVRGAGFAGAALVFVLAMWEPILIERVPGRSGAKQNAPNVILILVDALRWDHLTSYGYDRVTSPNIDRLAEEGVLFERAYAHGNRTIIATPSLFTSLYPSFHGAVGFYEHVVPLPESRTTIAEMLRSAGYSTVGMMSNIYLKTPFNLTQGFDRLEEFNDRRFEFSVYRVLVAFGFIEKPSTSRGVAPSATEVTDHAIEWLGHLPRDNPYFFYVHYMDVHHPYDPPLEYERLFRTSPGVNAIDADELFAKTVTLVKDPPPIDLGPQELERLTNLYDGCIRYTDAEVGRFLDAVRAMNSDRETIVIFTADHGDEFMEHGSIYHVNVVIEELIRVPLIVWRSGRVDEAIETAQPRRVEEMVRHIDVLPTVAELVGVDPPEEAMGKSLVPALDGTGPVDVGESIAEGDFCTALIRPDWKVMRVDTSGAEYLYDLVNDPRATRNVAGAHADVHADMRARLDDYLKVVEDLQKDAGKGASVEMIRQLKALGYIN